MKVMSCLFVWLFIVCLCVMVMVGNILMLIFLLGILIVYWLIVDWGVVMEKLFVLGVFLYVLRYFNLSWIKWGFGFGLFVIKWYLVFGLKMMWVGWFVIWVMWMVVVLRWSGILFYFFGGSLIFRIVLIVIIDFLICVLLLIFWMIGLMGCLIGVGFFWLVCVVCYSVWNFLYVRNIFWFFCLKILWSFL